MTRKSMRLTFITFIIFIAFILVIQFLPTTKLITKNVEEIQKITVANLRIGNRITYLTQTENQDLINRIYQSINTTKTRRETKPDASEEMTADPYFTITIDYLDGTKDIIYSGESSNYIYERLAGTGWIGGKNNSLIIIVNGL